jgi:hypothetical protein
MRTILIAMVAAAGIGLFGASVTFGAPVNNTVIAGAAHATSSVVEARVYCRGHYRRSSRWVFLHWGHC